MVNQIEPSITSSPIIWVPSTIEEAIELKRKFGSKAEFVSGSTLLQLQWMNGRKIPENIISLEQISKLKEVQIDEDKKTLSIGASSQLSSYKTDRLLKNFPIICEALKSIAAPAVRNRGTIGGNIMGGVGDLIPLFLALKAKLLVHDEKESELVDFWEWLQHSQRKNQTLLSTIHLPIIKECANSYSFYKKIGRRETFTAAILTVSGSVRWDDHGVIEEAKLALGGGDNKPFLLENTEHKMIGKKGEEIDWKSVFESITSEIAPADDAFVSGDYRKKVAANLMIAALQSKFTVISNGEEESSYEV
ncbi:FAD binding domain-containing protein [Rummeliibacillus suwonensis]|uniref:FAD binding domain-containing protein n=1 Tax=Rummeliibacillus suwonensis TaxID=1306154 RepID=UPI001AAF367B|nr:FAD binding domain-containing protein [Rummeliibacillus suwonensis]MBO2537684.1 FAD binding domain-containing protein [Rummeliibacillus suwonensis]